MNKRLSYIDIAKGILILLLPIHHYGSVLSRIDLSTNNDWIITKYQYILGCFFMSAFFIISGYCSNFNKNNKEFWKGNFKGIILPYITFTIISCLINVFQYGNINKLVDSFVNYQTHCNLWFLFALIGSKTIVYYLQKLIESQNFISNLFMHCICLMLLSVAVFCNNHFPSYNIIAIYHTLIASFFVLFGYDMKHYNGIYTHLKQHSLYLFPIIIIIFNILNFQFPNFTAGIVIKLYQIPFFIVLAIMGTMFTLRFSEIIGKSTLLEFAGQNSLIIYALHFIPLFNLFPIIYDMTNANSTLINFIIFIITLYAIEYLCCFGMIYIFSSTKLKVLIGR